MRRTSLIARPGEGSRLVSTMGNNARLASAARAIRLGDHIVTHPGYVGATSGKMLATCVQALLGAVYLHSGKDMAVVNYAMRALSLVD